VVACENWKAWHSRKPAQPAILYVQAQCKFPTAGYKVELRRASALGIDPAILVLDLVINELPGPHADVITRMEVRYQEKTHQRYEHVQIRPDNIVVNVEEVS
jgi:hypothetical protein